MGVIAPKYREIQLEFTASQYNGPEGKLYLPYYSGNGMFSDDGSRSLVRNGNYILTDQFGKQWQIGETLFKSVFERIDEIR